jgi:cold shock CspA family protein
MPVGTVKKLGGDRGFGFIKTDRGGLFFHLSALQELQSEELERG